MGQNPRPEDLLGPDLRRGVPLGAMANGQPQQLTVPFRAPDGTIVSNMPVPVAQLLVLQSIDIELGKITGLLRRIAGIQDELEPDTGTDEIKGAGHAGP